jgi:hypothetical protein
MGLLNILHQTGMLPTVFLVSFESSQREGVDGLVMQNFSNIE